MRLIAITTALLLMTAPAVTAEPPPTKQKPAVAAAPAQTASDAGAAKADTFYSPGTATASSTAVVDSTASAEPERGHGWIWWLVIAAIVLIVAGLAYRYITREPEPIAASPRSTAPYDEPPDTTAKRPPRNRNLDD